MIRPGGERVGGHKAQFIFYISSYIYASNIPPPTGLQSSNAVLSFIVCKLLCIIIIIFSLPTSVSLR